MNKNEIILKFFTYSILFNVAAVVYLRVFEVSFNMIPLKIHGYISMFGFFGSGIYKMMNGKDE